MSKDQKVDKPDKVPEKVAETAEEKKERLLKAIALRKQKSKYLTASDWQEFLNSNVSGYEHLPKGHHLYATLTAGCGPKAKKPKLAPAAAGAPPPVKSKYQPPKFTQSRRQGVGSLQVQPSTKIGKKLPHIAPSSKAQTVQKKVAANTGHMRIINPDLKCYAIASLHLLFAMPTFRDYVLNPAQFSSAKEEDKMALQALQYFARCSLAVEPPNDELILQHSSVFFTHIAEGFCNLSKKQENDPAEFITLLVEYLKQKFAIQIDMDLFQSEVVAESVHCQICNYEICVKKDQQIIFKVPLFQTQSIQHLVKRSLQETIELNCCNQEVERISKFTKLPEVLLVQLLRYSTGADGKTQKLQTPVKISQTLKLKLEDSDRDGANEITNVSYSLKAVITHIGEEVSTGHYKAIVFDDAENQWVSANDSDVKAVVSIDDEIRNKEVKGNCYLLAYQKRPVV